MSFHAYFDLTTDPFSTTPDPRFFYLSKFHKKALHRLEISIRLRRGLNVILGEVGSGKTSLARALLGRFEPNESFEFYLITDPGSASEFQFLFSLLKVFRITPPARSTFEYKNSIKDFLYKKNVEQGVTPVLIIDEGQKLTTGLLEILRIFLNYETNEYKMLQLVILGQLEFLSTLGKMKNFMDRIVYKSVLEPLDEEDTRQIIFHRLGVAGSLNPASIIDTAAIHLIHEASEGRPRKLTHFMNEALLNAVMDTKTHIDAECAAKIIEQENRWPGVVEKKCIKPMEKPVYVETNTVTENVAN